MNSIGPLVSVVIPVYNTAEYLGECIQSIIVQTYQNLELVVLDNRSTDASLSIARAYAGKDSRIRVIEADSFVGQIENYNRALKEIAADSKYTKIVEADNWIYPDCLEKMVSLAEANDNLTLISAYNVTEQVVRFHGASYLKGVYSGREAARLYLLKGAYLFGAPTTVLIRSNVLRSKESFLPDDGIYAEDLRACFSLLKDGDFGFVHQILTFVRTENESILSKVKDFDAMTLDRLIVAKCCGSNFLSEREFAKRIRRFRINEYDRLAFGLLTGKGRAFWRFHKKGMESIGEKIGIARLGFFLLRTIAIWILNPGQSVSALAARVKSGIR